MGSSRVSRRLKLSRRLLVTLTSVVVLAAIAGCSSTESSFGATSSEPTTTSEVAATLPSTSTSMVPSGPFDTATREALAVTPDEERFADIANACAADMSFEGAEGRAIRAGYNPQFPFWIEFPVGTKMISVTFPGVTKAGPPLVDYTPATLRSGQPGSIGTYEGSLFANFPSVTPNCTAVQVSTSLLDRSDFEVALARLRFG